MNLGNLLKGALSALTGGVSNLFEGDNLGNALNNAGNTWADIGNQNMLGNLVAKYTGSRLTNAEQQANAFNALEAQKNRDFQQSMFEQQTELANTAYQRQVQDMQAAGINPMMAASGSGGAAVASPGSGAAATSVNPSGAGLNLGTLLSFILESKLLPAKLANLAADTAQKSANASQTEQQVNFFDRVAGLREEGERLANDMTRKEMREIDSRITKYAAETDNQVAQALLARTNADNIKYMQPFISAELTARSQNERAQAKVAAVEAAYRQKMIDLGAIEAAVRQQNAQASEFEINAKTKEFAQSITDGSLQRAADMVGDWRTSVIAGLYSALSNASKSVLGKW